MKKTILHAACALLALLVCLASFPLAAPKANAEVEIPVGFRRNDYLKIYAFLEQKDENGVKNGEKLSDAYDPENPNSWGDSFTWGYDGKESFIEKIRFTWPGFVGRLDLSGCTDLKLLQCPYDPLTAIDLSGCSALESLSCHSTYTIESLDLSGCSALTEVVANTNALRYIDLSGCKSLKSLNIGFNELYELELYSLTSLEFLSCSVNHLSEFDASCVPSLQTLYCTSNDFETLDLRPCKALYTLACRSCPLRELFLPDRDSLILSELRTEGCGTVGYSNSGGRMVYANAEEGCDFLGWYSKSGDLISSETDYDFSGCGETVLFARFTDPRLPGDVNLDGNVTVLDAVLALRGAMNIVTLEGIGAVNADFNGDGDVTVLDAVLILRKAMGIK